MPGPGDILELIRTGRATTRGELLDVTGLSRMTVAARVDALLEAKFVVEDGTTRVTGGRPSRRLQFNSARASLLAIMIDTTYTTVALTDLAGRVEVEEVISAKVADGPSRALTEIAASARALLKRTSTPVDRVGGMGVSVPGPVDPDTGRPSQPPIMPGWDAYPIAEHLDDALGVPVFVANDADAAALGEQRTAHPRSRSLCLIKVSSGIGAGIVIGGQVYRGADGGAGDIGHVKIAEHDAATCQCGARGCLAAVASGHAVARALTELGKPAASGVDVGRYLSAGDVDAARLMQAAGRAIGEVVATVVSLLNPAEVVVGGVLASPPLITGVREALYPRSLPRATRHLMISQSMLAERAEVIGLAAMVLEREYSTTSVNAALNPS